MGIDKRGLRKIVRANRLFYWCVYPNEDDEDLLYLVIKSEDNRFRVHYRLGQSKDNPFIIVQGNEFKRWRVWKKVGCDFWCLIGRMR